MKKIIINFLIILLLITVTGCESEKGNDSSKISVVGVSLNHSVFTMVEDDDAVFFATIYPSNATNQTIFWETDDESVAEVETGMNIDGVESAVIIARSEGIANIIVTTEDGAYSASCEVTVTQKYIPVENVTLNKNSMDLAKGESETLIVYVSPYDATDRSSTWSSTNTNVATVDANGTVTAVGGGSATIKVTSHDESIFDECHVNVTVPVVGVSLNKRSISIEEGQTARLIAEINPSDATNSNVTWSSSKNSVATVSNGLVRGVAPGSAIITVATLDGGKTATCTVAITAKTVAVQSVSLNITSRLLSLGERFQLTPTIIPENATNKNVTYTSSNPDVATVSNPQVITSAKVPVVIPGGIVTARRKGTTIITVKTEDGNKTAMCRVTVWENIKTPPELPKKPPIIN